MRKKLLTVTILSAVIAVALVVALVVGGCGTANQVGAQAQVGPNDARGILTQALSSTGNVSSGTGDFKVSLTVDADASKLPAGAEIFLGQPITLSGTYSFNTDPRAAEANLTVPIVGQSIALGLKAVGGQAWIQFMGQWYQAPADLVKKATDGTSTTAQQSNAAAITQALAAAGVDPNTWLTDLRLIGEETINGAATYHLAASVDVSKIAADVAKLIQSGALKNLMPGGAAESSPTTGGQAPSPPITTPSEQQLQTMESQLSTVFQNLTLDIWVAKDNYQVRQLEVKATIVPPVNSPDTESTTAQSTETTESATQAATQAMLQGIAQGIKSLSIDATVSLTPSTTPVTVTPPTDVKPWTDLQQALSGLSGLLSGALGGGMQGSSTTAGQ